MSEIVLFRLTLVVVGAVILVTSGLWAWNTAGETEAREAVARSFDEYNRYIDACGNAKAGEVWDLALRSRAALDRASTRRDDYERRRDVCAWLGLGFSVGLFATFYSLRWALTGRLRPLWLLGRHTSG
jgi:hypothetical protein